MSGLELSHGAALLAGLLSFASPCVLPLVLPYLGFIGGVTMRATPEGAVAEVPDRARVMLAALAFVAGFGTVFVALGATASALSQLLADHLDQLAWVAGAVLVLFGLHMTGLLRLAPLYRELRPMQVRARPAGPLGAYVVGLAFAFGWTPCVGPVLAAILTMAAADGGVAHGAGLLGAYALGIGIPFLIAAAFVTRFMAWAKPLRRQARLVEAISGGLLIIAGLLVATGGFPVIGGWLLEAFPALGRVG